MSADEIGTRPSTLSIVSVLFLSVVTVGAMAAPAGAQSASATEIDACTTITEPGTYVLTGDIRDSDAGTCIDVRADDVTIDGSGHAIDGQSGSGQVGIGATSQSNVTVRNVAVSEWDAGINYTEVTGGEVSGVTARSNTIGIELAAGSENTIANNTVLDTDNGIYLHAIDETTADRNTIRDNAVTNTTLAINFVGADNNTVTNNTIRQSGLYGLSLLFSPTGNDYNDFRDNVVVDRTEDAVCLLRSSHNTFENTYVENSGRYDVYAVNGSTDNRMTNLTLTSATLSTELRDVSLVAVDDPPTTSPASNGNASAVGYVNATDTSPGTDAGSELYLTVDAPGANGSAEAAENGVPAYRYADDEWVSIGENVTGENATGTNITDLGASGTHQLLAFVGDGFASTAPETAATGDSAAGNGTETETEAETGTGTQATTESGATDTGTDGSTATDSGNATAGTDAAGTATTDGGGQTTETSGPGFGLVLAVLAVLAAAVLAARRN